MQEFTKKLNQIINENPTIEFNMRPSSFKTLLHKYKFYKSLKNKKVVDLGGGVDIFNLVLVKLGFEVTVVDFFEYDLGWGDKSDFNTIFKKKFELFEKSGINFVNTDLINFNLQSLFKEKTIGLVSSYHCLEHFKESPVPLIISSLKVLEDGGQLIIEVPNSVNLIKRLKVLLGKTNYCNYYDYANSTNFTGHIREYSVEDLKKLSNILKLKNVEIFGRNYFGSLYEKFGDNIFTAAVDNLLKLFPGICASLFLKYIK